MTRRSNARYILILLYTLVGLSTILNGQDRTIRGQVLSLNTKNAIENATISIHKTALGTISNSEGTFNLRVPGESTNDTAFISSIGYKPVSVPISTFEESHNPVVIYLEKDIIEIEAVAVRNLSIPEILERAITTTNSLIQKSNTLASYYREFAFIDKELFKYADASLLYDVSVDNKKTKVNAYVLESRMIKDSITTDKEEWKSKIESLIDVNKSVKEFYTLDYLMTFISSKKSQKFNFELRQSDTQQQITINPTDSSIYLPSAIVFIDRGTNKISRVDYGFKNYLPKLNLLILKLAVMKDWATCIYDIQNENEVFLRYAKLSYDFEFKYKKMGGYWGSTTETLIKQPVSSTEIATLDKYNKRSIKKNGDRYDTDFWEDYTDIIPTQGELESIIKPNN